MAIRLSRRLSAVAGFVTPGNRLADVGTDHGYVPIALCEQGRIPRAIALDVREGPLQAARRNIAAAGLLGQVETRLSDGLSALAPGEADTVLLAGMGGALMQRILKEGAPVLAGVRELVLQPQSEIPALRRFLRCAGYEIPQETVVKEDGKYYVVLRAVPRTDAQNFLPEISVGGFRVCSGPAAGDGGESSFAAARGWQNASAEPALDSGGSQGISGSPAVANDFLNRFLPEDAFGPVLLAERPALWCEWIGVKYRETETILASLRRECEKHPENAKAAGRLEELERRRELLAAALEGTI